MKSKIFTLVTSLCLCMFSSCDKNFEAINTDPNRLESVRPETLLAPILLNSTNALLSRSHRINHELMQYSVQINVMQEFHRYVFRATEFDYMWNHLYRWAGNASDMYNLANDIGDRNNMAIALIVKAWLMAALTDIYGDIPYKDAFKGAEKVYFPSFDEQRDIYASLLDELEEANGLIDVNATYNAANDPLFGGNLLKWKKFSNSLRLRFLVRVSNRSEMDAPARINELFADPATFPIMASSDDGAVFKYTGVNPYVNILFQLRDFDFRGDRRMGSTFVNLLNKTSDPRRDLIMSRNRVGEFVGVESGQPVGITASLADNAGEGTSTYLTALQAANQPAYLLTYPEVLFNLAEAAQKGWIEADAESLYTEAVEEAVRQWGIQPAPEFMGGTYVAYNGTFEQLMEQKYLALFFVGFESWSEYRRTGLPTLFKGTGTDNGGRMPNRFEYPVIVKATNRENVEVAAQRMGGDNLNSPMWWQ
ncbi:SusD/RagB family nutrient-binding outer membrane lipoprotein [Parapedobacter deserti]|uniref:SusD/RagB family nutrient-binding outer membrane lipoprotein n=1 Tax=Parapedobacter deserti TaxID=1912957 RepID=A0ABV7JNI7_9SPHI